MSRLAIQGLSGVLVLAAGLVAFVMAINTPPVQPSVDVPSPVPIQALDPAIQRLLQGAGSAGPMTAEELAQLPAEVVRVLDQNGVVLAIPDGEVR